MSSCSYVTWVRSNPANAAPPKGNGLTESFVSNPRWTLSRGASSRASATSNIPRHLSGRVRGRHTAPRPELPTSRRHTSNPLRRQQCHVFTASHAGQAEATHRDPFPGPSPSATSCSGSMRPSSKSALFDWKPPPAETPTATRTARHGITHGEGGVQPVQNQGPCCSRAESSTRVKLKHRRATGLNKRWTPTNAKTLASRGFAMGHDKRQRTPTLAFPSKTADAAPSPIAHAEGHMLLQEGKNEHALVNVIITAVISSSSIQSRRSTIHSRGTGADAPDEG